ncbi:hypothetical protein [Streptomyces sp. F-1]|uniref:hypothetical protein n=1 Tax=Streptomyces sp. F-1 TaxID=463642 RepID=UPI00085C4378|nr:hypothetical protein [Streptomyces sp. F-1]SFY49607.1 hypothetical protein STEPF1_02846 [Streptomyces sp. F-1]
MDKAERLRDVSRLWEEHRRAAFPADVRGAEPAGVDLVLLDATVAGCVSGWLDGGGSLDAERGRILRDAVTDLDRVLPEIPGADGPRYFRHLRRLAVLVTAAPPGAAVR